MISGFLAILNAKVKRVNIPAPGSRLVGDLYMSQSWRRSWDLREGFSLLVTGIQALV